MAFIGGPGGVVFDAVAPKGELGAISGRPPLARGLGGGRVSAAAAADPRRVAGRSGGRAEPAFWVFAVFLVAGAVTTVRTLADLSGVSRSGWVLAWVLLAIYARADRRSSSTGSTCTSVSRSRSPPPPSRWGALGATGLSIQAAGWNDAFAAWLGARRRGHLGTRPGHPVIEEVLKAAGPRAARVHRARRVRRHDGRVRLRRARRPRVRRRRGRRLLHGRVRRHAVRASRGVLAAGAGERRLRSRAVHGARGDGDRRAREHPARRRDARAARRRSPPGSIARRRARPHRVEPARHEPARRLGVGARWCSRSRGYPCSSSWGSPSRWRTAGNAAGSPGRWPRRRSARRRHARRGEGPRATRRRGPPRCAPSADGRARGPATTLQRLQREQVNLAMMVSDRPEDTAAIATQRDRCASLRLALGAVPGAHA